jgi:hypothetical protein
MPRGWFASWSRATWTACTYAPVRLTKGSQGSRALHIYLYVLVGLGSGFISSLHVLMCACGWAGLPRDALAELHGDCFAERCVRGAG